MKVRAFREAIMTRNRWVPTAWALAFILLLGVGATNAELCTIDVVPAATLLIPYFEVGISNEACADPNVQTTTVVTVLNPRPEPALVFVTLWTNAGVPGLGFNIFLQGYDRHSLNLAEIFCSGYLPTTGPLFSNTGAASIPPTWGTYPNCSWSPVPDGTAPMYLNPAISSIYQVHLKAWFSGEMSPVTGSCASVPTGSQSATGYITIDVVRDCSLYLPVQPQYYSEPVIAHTNTLLGWYAIFDRANNSSSGFTAVHIESDDSGLFSVQTTFYGRYNPVPGSGIDGREPLPTAMSARFATAGLGDETMVTVWRETDASSGQFACGAAPSWYPLGLSNRDSLVAVDEQSNSRTLGELSFPLATQRVPASSLDLPFPLGYLHLNLQHEQTVYESIDPNKRYGQAWVSTEMQASGRYVSSSHGHQLDNACDLTAFTTNPPQPTVTNPTVP
jgi:hypothetical protein